METKKKLYRSTSDKAIAGVCGGIGEYLDIDSIVIRLIFVIFALVFGSGVLFYIIAAFIIPARPANADGASAFCGGSQTGADGASYGYTAADGTEYADSKSSYQEPQYTYTDEGEKVEKVEPQVVYEPGGKKPARRDTRAFIGTALVIFGILMIMKVIVPQIDSRLIVSIAVILLGIYLLSSKKK